MAVAPLFNSSISALKSACRLSGSSQPDSLKIIDDAVKRVWNGFYAKLGAARVAAIVAVTPTDTPTTDDQLSRSRAEQAEVLWVKALLLNDLPVTFVDSGGAVRETWNEDAITRNPSDSERRKLVEAYMAEVTELLDLIAAPAEVPDGIQGGTFGAASPVWSGSSIGNPS